MSRTILTGIFACLMTAIVFSEGSKAGQGSLSGFYDAPYFRTFPFQLLGNTIVIQATVDDRTGSFIVDTGSPTVIVNSRYFQNKRLMVTEYYSDDMTGSRNHLSKTIVRLQLQDIIRRGQQVFLMDLSSIEASKKVDILGIIGVDFLDRYELVIDYVEKEITLFSLDGKGERKTNNVIHSSPAKIIQLRKSRHFLYLQAKINEKKLKLGLDCGAEISVFEKESVRGFEADFLPSHAVWIVAIHGKKTIANVGSVRQIHIANIIMEIPEVIVTDLGAVNHHLIKDLDGLLGYGFLSQRKISINYKKRILSVWNPSGLVSLVREDVISQ